MIGIKPIVRVRNLLRPPSDLEKGHSVRWKKLTRFMHGWRQRLSEEVALPHSPFLKPLIRSACVGTHWAFNLNSARRGGVSYRFP